MPRDVVGIDDDGAAGVAPDDVFAVLDRVFRQLLPADEHIDLCAQNLGLRAGRRWIRNQACGGGDSLIGGQVKCAPADEAASAVKLSGLPDTVEPGRRSQWIDRGPAATAGGRPGNRALRMDRRRQSAGDGAVRIGHLGRLEQFFRGFFRLRLLRHVVALPRGIHAGVGSAGAASGDGEREAGDGRGSGGEGGGTWLRLGDPRGGRQLPVSGKVRDFMAGRA